jgi:hypothetical protein
VLRVGGDGEGLPCDDSSDETAPDWIILEDAAELDALKTTLERLRAVSRPNTRLIIRLPNRFRRGNACHTHQAIGHLLADAGFETLKTYRAVMLPVWIPFLSELLNRYAARLPLLRNLCLVRVLVCRPIAEARDPSDVSVSVIVPCKNERGNVESAVERIPAMGRQTEIIFVVDESPDGTLQAVEDVQRRFPGRRILLLEGPGRGKAQAVWAGFDAAGGDVLMILDGDLTVAPEELPRFFEAIVSGQGEFINGARMVYPMEKGAIRTVNWMGNKLFAWAFSLLLGQRISDSLCGTKVILGSDWRRIRPLIGSWGPPDPFGDFDLLLSAARLNLKIVDLPVRYRRRVYGATKVSVLSGWRLFRCWAAGFRKLRTGY